jgi:hypothetical protein
MLVKGAIKMANGRIKGMFLVGGMLVLSVQGWAQRGPGMGMRGSGNAGSCQTMIASLPKQDLSVAEAAGLTRLREEEKLARDVYTKLYATWGSRIFGNIAQSEQRHFDALKVLLDRYGLDDPAANNAAGVFTNAELQALYGDLVARGQVSLAAALRIGATIEDLDIHDLEIALAAADNDDLKIIYQNLQKGSRNHMRTFVGQLEALGESYAAQYISAAALAEILASLHESGMANWGSGNMRRGFGGGNGTCPWGNTPATNAGVGSPRP